MSSVTAQRLSASSPQSPLHLQLPAAMQADTPETPVGPAVQGRPPRVPAGTPALRGPSPTREPMAADATESPQPSNRKDSKWGQVLRSPGGKVLLAEARLNAANNRFQKAPSVATDAQVRQAHSALKRAVVEAADHFEAALGGESYHQPPLIEGQVGARGGKLEFDDEYVESAVRYAMQVHQGTPNAARWRKLIAALEKAGEPASLSIGAALNVMPRAQELEEQLELVLPPMPGAFPSATDADADLEANDPSKKQKRANIFPYHERQVIKHGLAVFPQLEEGAQPSDRYKAHDELRLRFQSRNAELQELLDDAFNGDDPAGPDAGFPFKKDTRFRLAAAQMREAAKKEEITPDHKNTAVYSVVGTSIVSLLMAYGGQKMDEWADQTLAASHPWAAAFVKFFARPVLWGTLEYVTCEGMDSFGVKRLMNKSQGKLKPFLEDLRENGMDSLVAGAKCGAIALPGTYFRLFRDVAVNKYGKLAQVGGVLAQSLFNALGTVGGGIIIPTELKKLCDEITAAVLYDLVKGDHLRQDLKGKSEEEIRKAVYDSVSRAQRTSRGDGAAGDSLGWGQGISFVANTAVDMACTLLEVRPFVAEAATIITTTPTEAISLLATLVAKDAEALPGTTRDQKFKNGLRLIMDQARARLEGDPKARVRPEDVQQFLMDIIPEEALYGTEHDKAEYTHKVGVIVADMVSAVTDALVGGPENNSMELSSKVDVSPLVQMPCTFPGDEDESPAPSRRIDETTPLLGR